MDFVRLVVALVMVGCGGSGAAEPCPTMLQDGDACGFDGRCWRDDTFSGCLSGWCRCEAGRVDCEPLAPQTGDVCGDEPISSCSYEGVPGCDTPPTAEFCACREDGSWRCTCACYGGSSTCSACPVGLTLPEIEGLRCATAGATCAYPSGSCRCVDPGTGDPSSFACDPTVTAGRSLEDPPE